MLENTDAALAKILELIVQAGQPDAINTAGQVAMYAAQGDLMCAHIFLGVSIVGFIIFALASGAASASSNDGSAGGLGLLCFVFVIIFGFSLTSTLSPLNQATAKDPKLAFAYTVMQKFTNQK